MIRFMAAVAAKCIFVCAFRPCDWYAAFVGGGYRDSTWCQN